MTRPKELRTEFEPGRGYTREDWDDINDDAEPTDEELAQAKPFAEAHPELARAILREQPEFAEVMKRPRGRPRVERPRKTVSIRLDPEVLAKFKATGKGWQSRINDILMKAKP